MTTSFTRRSMLTGAGAGGALAAGGLLTVTGSDGTADAATVFASSTTQVAAAATSCATASSEQEEGPFYVEEGLVRSDITSGEGGIPLTLTVTVMDPDTCEPAAGLAVDIWHANAAGEYSDESSEGTTGETFLRGLQVTDSAGQVRFTSVMPGWYAGRTIHIHDRIYTGGTVSGSSYSYTGATLLYTGQFFFSDDIDSAVAGASPYTSNRTTRTTNSQDRVYTAQSGSDHVLTVTGSSSSGYAAAVTLYVAADGTSTAGDDEDDSSITLGVSDRRVVAGEKLSLHGVLTDTTTGDPISYATVHITQTLDGNTRTATVRTDSEGAWALNYRAHHSVVVQATYAGDDEHLACSSPAKTVPVHYRVPITHVTSTGSHVDPVRISGAVRPAHRGIRVTLARVTNGARHAIGDTTTDTGGDWQLTWSAPIGTHQLVATVVGSDHLSGGRSRMLTVRRT